MIFGLLISYARALSRESKKVSRYRKSNLQFSEKPSKLKLRDEAEKHGWEQNELQKSIKSENMIFLRRNVVRTPIKPLCTEQDRNRSPISNVLLQSSPNPGNQLAYQRANFIEENKRTSSIMLDVEYVHNPSESSCWVRKRVGDFQKRKKVVFNLLSISLIFQGSIGFTALTENMLHPHTHNYVSTHGPRPRFYQWDPSIISTEPTRTDGPFPRRDKILAAAPYHSECATRVFSGQIGRASCRERV